MVGIEEAVHSLGLSFPSGRATIDSIQFITTKTRRARREQARKTRSEDIEPIAELVGGTMLKVHRALRRRPVGIGFFNFLRDLGVFAVKSSPRRPRRHLRLESVRGVPCASCIPHAVGRFGFSGISPGQSKSTPIVV
jgi:hypothetical protein